MQDPIRKQKTPSTIKHIIINTSDASIIHIIKEAGIKLLIFLSSQFSHIQHDEVCLFHLAIFASSSPLIRLHAFSSLSKSWFSPINPKRANTKPVNSDGITDRN